MRKFGKIALTIATFASLRPQSMAAENRTLVANALDWYSIWQGDSHGEPMTQTCHGELRSGLFRFRCDPLSVVLDVSVDDRGRCLITFMRPARDPGDGLRVQTFVPPIPIGMRPRSGGELPPRKDTCGELPVQAGAFEIEVKPLVRQIDRVLSAKARGAAFAYNKSGGDSPCTLRLPKIRAGDPFFHVYEDCDGRIDNVWEFTIDDGEPSDFPHWSYSQEKHDLPAGSQRRSDDPDFWLEVSRPQQRRAR